MSKAGLNAEITTLRTVSPERESGFLTANDGAQLYFEDTGGSGPVLFFVYGLGCTIRHWKYTRAHFESRQNRGRPYRQIWFDFRGQGQSDDMKPGVRLSIRRIVDDIHTVCQARKVRKSVILGQSLGGTIAMQYAATYPDETSALVLLGAPTGNPGRDLPVRPLLPMIWNGASKLNHFSKWPLRFVYNQVVALRKAGVGPDQIPIVKDLFLDVIRRNGFNVELAKEQDIIEYIDGIFEVPMDLFFDLAHDLNGFDYRVTGAKITAPTLIISGANDYIVPVEQARKLKGVIADSELLEVPHGSHCPHMDDPGLVNRRIQEFLTKFGI